MARRYTDEEKAEAVRLVRRMQAELGTNRGATKRAAEQLGYSASSVAAWVRDADGAAGSSPPEPTGGDIAGTPEVPAPPAPVPDRHPPGWWIASDGKWYPPELHPARRAGAQPAEGGVEDPDRRSKLTRAAAAVLVLVIAVVAVVLLGGDDDETSDSAPGGVARTTTTGGGPFDTTAPEQQGDLSVVSGFTSDEDSFGGRSTSVGALVTNPDKSLAAYDVTVVFNLLDADGGIIDTTSEGVPYIPAGSTVPVAPTLLGFDRPTEPASVEVNITASFQPDRGWSGVEFSIYDGIDIEVTDAAVVAGGFSDEVSFIATNPSDQVADFGTWTCVMRRDGVIVGGETSGLGDPIVPGSSILVSSSTSVEGLLPDEVICRAYA